MAMECDGAWRGIMPSCAACAAGRSLRVLLRLRLRLLLDRRRRRLLLLLLLPRAAPALLRGLLLAFVTAVDHGVPVPLPLLAPGHRAMAVLAVLGELVHSAIEDHAVTSAGRSATCTSSGASLLSPALATHLSRQQQPRRYDEQPRSGGHA
jgi:hypothetical protein